MVNSVLLLGIQRLSVRPMDRQTDRLDKDLSYPYVAICFTGALHMLLCSICLKAVKLAGYS